VAGSYALPDPMSSFSSGILRKLPGKYNEFQAV
jgi:hypothetical protein